MSGSSKVMALFPGQGSQKVGMGKGLYEKYAGVRNLFERAEQATGLALGALCFDGPDEELKGTAVAQPAILTVSIACWQVYLEERAGSLNFVAAAGHSLGEYSALVAAGALLFEDACLLVHKRGKYMQSAVPIGQGKMVAVLGREVSEIEAVASKVEGVVEVANINSPGQIVVAGSAASVDNFKQALGGKIIDLPVSAPFHCGLMRPAAEKLANDLATTKISKPKFPVFSNFSAEATSDPEKIRQALIDQVCGRVRWVECMLNAKSVFGPDEWIEFGEGNTLTNLLKRIDPELNRKNYP